MAIGRTKAYSTNEFIRILFDNGFEKDRQRGTHFIYKRGNETVVINKDINKMIARRLIKEHNLKIS